MVLHGPIHLIPISITKLLTVRVQSFKKKSKSVIISDKLNILCRHHITFVQNSSNRFPFEKLDNSSKWIKSTETSLASSNVH